MYSTILVIAKTFGQSFFAMFGKQWKQTKPRCFIFFGMLILTISRHGVVSFAAARGPKSLKGDQPSRFCGCLKGIHQRINTVPVIHRSRHEYSRKSFSFGVRRRYGSLLIVVLFLATKSLFWTLKSSRHAVIRFVVKVWITLKEHQDQFLARCAAKSELLEYLCDAIANKSPGTLSCLQGQGATRHG